MYKWWSPKIWMIRTLIDQLFPRTGERFRLDEYLISKYRYQTKIGRLTSSLDSVDRYRHRYKTLNFFERRVLTQTIDIGSEQSHFCEALRLESDKIDDMTCHESKRH